MFEINNIYWKIKFVSPYDRSLLTDNMYYTIGVCNNSNKTIYIANDLHGKLLKKVLCHELVHAAMYSYNVNITIDQEELIADAIATYGQEILHINNKIFKRLQLL